MPRAELPRAEFDCKRCGIHVVLIVEEVPADRLCLECRFIESQPKEALTRFLDRTKEGP
jgi:hypothetical protein